MMEECVEEGEIYDDFAYIDEKLERVLGHFMKDFQGGAVCVENLGPRFGVYGSFLPSYQRPPSILFQPTTLHTSRFLCGDDSARKCTDLHTVLGLMNSPTKSVEVSSKFREITSDISPTRILHTMTSFPVDGNLLLSPLPEKFLTLSRNKKLFAKNDKYDHQEVISNSVEFQFKSFQKDSTFDCKEEGGRRKKAVTKDARRKPDQPRMPHTEKQSSESNKKLTERQPSSKELTSRDEQSVSSFVIEEDWICCDKCQKWRLLPYGTKPEQLSESWLCSMLNWLPGMNRCDISEEDTTQALHALYRILSGLIDVKAHNGREISVKKRKLRDQDYLMTLQCNGNHLDDNDANGFERKVNGESGLRKQKKSKVSQTEKRELSTRKGEEKSRTRGTLTRITPGIKDSPRIDMSTVEKEHQTKKYRVKVQSQADFGMISKQVCKFPLKKALGYGKEVRTCIAIW